MEGKEELCSNGIKLKIKQTQKYEFPNRTQHDIPISANLFGHAMGFCFDAATKLKTC